MSEFHAKSHNDLKDIASKVVHEALAQRGALRATVVGLYGDLGSGKTTFVKNIAEVLGISEPVVSPTFIIERVYAMHHAQFTHFIHIDAYRLKDGKELLRLGWDDIAKDPKNLVFIEWADRVEAVLPKDAIKIYFEGVDERTRKVRIAESQS
ncbi:MAG: tRNA (adenosine(37)-N6)-threonylcarbamoyltransferase complex ATPase subunit type 1 TsaE [Parcubacteria group bacterium]|nr:tRNA (adenosine(37)-N6)-threonylcarbamoyltransferase complex ATPase subunit type 1 TsaE [Parcubacteria group bacterium]